MINSQHKFKKQLAPEEKTYETAAVGYKSAKQEHKIGYVIIESPYIHIILIT